MPLKLFSISEFYSHENEEQNSNNYNYGLATLYKSLAREDSRSFIMQHLAPNVGLISNEKKNDVL